MLTVERLRTPDNARRVPQPAVRRVERRRSPVVLPSNFGLNRVIVTPPAQPQPPPISASSVWNEGCLKVDFCRAGSTFVEADSSCCSCPAPRPAPASWRPTVTPSRRACGGRGRRRGPGSASSPSRPASAALLTRERPARAVVWFAAATYGADDARRLPPGRRALPGRRRRRWTSPPARRSASARRAAAGGGPPRAGSSSEAALVWAFSESARREIAGRARPRAIAVVPPAVDTAWFRLRRRRRRASGSCCPPAPPSGR